MFKKILALVLATMMVLGGMVTVSAAEETAAAEEVVYDYTAAAEDLAALGILKGDGIDFALQNGVTRWQMALFVARIMTGETNDQYWNKVSDNTTPYSDVVNYFGAISFADENGIIKGKGWIPGVGDNCFDPNGAITFQDAITMAVRALGSKQLAYPDGFLAVGEDLGLMEGLEPLAKDAALTRGQMIQILKNMLYIKVNGAASFAEQNFGLEETVYVIVATELQYLVGADRVYRVDYIGAKANEQTKYVALAPLNADGTYDLEKVIHLTEEELGLAQRESETKLGYSYTIRSFSKFADAYSVVANETKTVKNYGDEGKAIVAGSKYMNVKDNIVSIDGQTYKMVTKYTDLYNKSSYANKQPELIVHSMYVGATDITNSYYMYDAAGNILNKDTYQVALLYNVWTQTYYAVVYDQAGNQVGYRQATEKDFADCAVTSKYGTDQYGVITDATQMTTVSFSEVTMIDDNGDGKWDRAIYIPYSVGKYEASNETGAWRFDQSKAYTDSTKKKIVEINDVDLKAWATNDKGEWGTAPRAAKVQEAEMFFLGEGRPASGEYVVYYYNPYSRTMTVVQNLGKPVTGVVNALTQGTYAYDSTNATYFYNGATVTIDGVTYKLGYRPYETAKKDSTDLLALNANLANYGYDEVLYKALVGNTYNKLSYLVLAGRLVMADNAGNTCGWMAFDYGTYTEKNSTYPSDSALYSPYTTYEYTGDIIGVDVDGNILVKAYVDTTGDAQVAKIGAINGFNYGLLVEDYAALRFQFTGTGILGLNAVDTMKKIVIADFFKTLTADLGNSQRQYVYIVTGVSDDGVYDVYTDLNLYWPNGSSWRQPTTAKHNKTITFVNGIATDYVCLGTDGKYDDALVLNTESVILVAGQDGLKVKTGIPANYASINYADADGNTAVTYAISSDFIFVASKGMQCDEIYTGKDWDSNATTGGYTYYMVLGEPTSNKYQGNTNATAAYDAAANALVYTYTNIYNINTGAYETIKVVGGLAKYNTTNDIYGLNNPKPIGAIYAEKNGVYTLLTTNIVPKELVSDAYKIQYQYATDSKAVLKDLLLNGTVKYEGIYDSVAKLGGKAPSGNMIKFASNNIYDPAVSFKYDLITYTDSSVLLSQNDRASTNDHSGAAIFYTYVEGVSFKATAIAGEGDKLPTVNPDPNAPTLAGTKLAAIERLTKLANGKVSIGAYETAIKNALTIAEVNALEAKFTEEINTALGNQADYASKRAKLVQQLKDIQASELYKTYAETAKTPAGATIKAHVEAWIAVADDTADIYNNDQMEANIKIANDALAAAAKADSDAVVKVAADNNSINVYTETAGLVTYVTYVKVYSKDAAGYWTKLEANINPVNNTCDGILAGFTATKNSNAAANGTLITLAKTDAAGTSIPAFVDGAEYLFVVTYANGAKTASAVATIG